MRHKKASQAMCTHINSDDNNAMMGAFYDIEGEKP